MGVARVTEAGVYVEFADELVQVTEAGVYVEHGDELVQVTVAGVYVEHYSPTRTTILYDGNDISSYVHSYRLECSIEQWDATDFASVGNEYGSGTPKWRLPVKGYWDSSWDEIMMTDVVTSPTTSKSAKVTFYDKVSGGYVSFLFVNASIRKMDISADVKTAIEWDSELILSGAPTRSVVA